MNNLDIDIVDLLRLLTIDAVTVQSTAAISGACGQLVATGTTTLTNSSVGGSLGVGISASSNPAPNTLLLNAGGIRVILNEQIRGGDGVNNLSLTVNAIHIFLNDVPVSGIGTVEGDIIISQSHVELTCPLAAADVALTMTANPSPVSAGSDLTFTIGVTNNGPQAATNVTVTDSLPQNATFVSAGATQGSCTGTSTISCKLGTVNPGSQATVTIVVRPQAAGTLTNTATVSATEPDPNPGNNSATTSVTVTQPAANADISITKSASPSPATVGENLTFTIGFTNGGPQAATNVTVTDTLPQNATFVSADATQGSCTGTSTIICSLGTVNPGGQATVTIVVRPQAAGSLTNTATVFATESDPNLGNNNATTTVTVIQPAVGADVFISMSASPVPATVGEPLTLTLTVGNGGPSTATGVTVTDTLPESTSLVSVSPTQGTCAASGGTFTCNLGTLANGAEVRIIFTVTPNQPGTITNRASVALNETDPDPADNTATLQVLVNPPTEERPAEVTLFPIFGEGQDLSSTLILINPCPNETASGTVELFDPEGMPLAVKFNGTVEIGSFNFDIPPLGVLFFRTAGEGDLTIGSIQLLSNIPVDGSIIFAGPFGVAGVKSVKASTRFVIPIESDLARGIRSGVAISNPDSSPVDVTLTLRDSTGAVVPNGVITITLPPHGMTSQFVDEFFAGQGIDFSNFDGSLEVSASTPVGGIAIRLSPGEFATLPVTPVNVECKVECQ